MMRLRGALVALALLGLAAECVMVVESGEVVVVYRFGAVARTAGAGLSLRAPRPIERDERIGVGEARRVETGERRILTGDTNLVDLDLVVQYAISDPQAFTLGAVDPEAVVIREVQAAATEVVSTLEVDFLMTTGRAALQQELRTRAQAQLDRMALGVQLDDVDVRDLSPPPSVVDAFNDVSSARGDRDTLALAADAYASDVVPDARGEAARDVEQARADASTLEARARGDAARFEALLGPWRAEPGALRAQLEAELLRDLGEDLTVMSAAPGTELYLE